MVGESKQCILGQRSRFRITRIENCSNVQSLSAKLGNTRQEQDKDCSKSLIIVLYIRADS